MGFLMTTIIFFVVGVVASVSVRLCCNRGPSTNLYVIASIPPLSWLLGVSWAFGKGLCSNFSIHSFLRMERSMEFFT
ncbi:hypothetical protein BHE74_00042979 [Ensete ventricosum]|nr:hypothetical protein GW17_00034867 [Ensete ventricosum]RWW50736.1 hypothetical protein BHE74_00042979 [Ensete ventricosum]RZS24087.1 hypothetical protein BHM03_00057116 [Ensete ventricosum]